MIHISIESPCLFEWQEVMLSIILQFLDKGTFHSPAQNKNNVNLKTSFQNCKEKTKLMLKKKHHNLLNLIFSHTMLVCSFIQSFALR